MTASTAGEDFDDEVRKYLALGLSSIPYLTQYHFRIS